MPDNLEGKLDSIQAPLAVGFSQIVPETARTAAEISVERQDNEELRDQWFYTADLSLVRKREGQLEYGIAGRETFLAVAGEDIKEFCRQLTDTNEGFYTLTAQQRASLDAQLASDIKWVDPKKLKLQKHSVQWSYFEIDTSDSAGKKLNDHQKPHAEAGYGSLEEKTDDEGRKFTDYGETMKMLHQNGISRTKVWLPTIKYAEKHVKEDQVVARACRLGDFGGGSGFDADVRFVDGSCNLLRGVRREEVAVGGDAEKLGVPEAYQTLLDNPSEITPEIAVGLSNLLTNYLKQNQ